MQELVKRTKKSLNHKSCREDPRAGTQTSRNIHERGSEVKTRNELENEEKIKSLWVILRKGRTENSKPHRGYPRSNKKDRVPHLK